VSRLNEMGGVPGQGTPDLRRPAAAEDPTVTEEDFGKDRQCVAMVKAREPDDYGKGYKAVHVDNNPNLRIHYILDPLGNVVWRRCRQAPMHGASYCQTHRTGQGAAALAARKHVVRDKALETIQAALDHADVNTRVRAAKVALDYLGREPDDTTAAVRALFEQFERQVAGEAEKRANDPASD
jgi:hypothetical protein